MDLRQENREERERTKVQKVIFGGGGYLDTRLEFEDRCKGAEAAAVRETLDGRGQRGILRISGPFILFRKADDELVFLKSEIVFAVIALCIFF